MATISRTWVFSLNTETLADVGDSALLPVNWDSAAAMLEFGPATGAATDFERARGSLVAGQDMWTNVFHGLPSGSTVTSIQCTAWQYQQFQVTGLTSWRIRIRIVDTTGTIVHSAGELIDFTNNAPAVNGTPVTGAAPGTSRAIDPAYQAANTIVALELRYDRVGGAAQDVDFDNIAITLTYDPPPIAPGTELQGTVSTTPPIEQIATAVPYEVSPTTSAASMPPVPIQTYSEQAVSGGYIVSQTVSTTVFIVQAPAGSTNFSSPAGVSLLISLNTIPGNTVFNTGADSAAIAPQSVPANTGFSALPSALAENLNAVPANTVFSALDSAAIAPQSVPANTGFSAPPATFAQAAQAPPATTTFSAIAGFPPLVIQSVPASATYGAFDSLLFAASPSSASTLYSIPPIKPTESVTTPVGSTGFSVATPSLAESLAATPASTTYSAIDRAATAPQAPNSTTTFNSGTQKLGYNAQSVPANVTFSSGAVSVAGLPILITTVPANTVFNTGTDTVVRSINAVPASTTFNTGIATGQFVANPNSANTAFTSPPPVAVFLVGGAAGNVTYSTGTTKGLISVNTNSATCTFNSIATTTESLNVPSASTTYSATATQTSAVTSPVASTTFDAGTEQVVWDTGQRAGFVTMRVFTNGSCTLKEFTAGTAKLSNFSKNQVILRTRVL